MAKRDIEPKPVAVGDAVYLRSGSQKMTVVAVMQDFKGVEVANVVWMGYGTADLREAQIPVAALRVTAAWGD